MAKHYTDIHRLVILLTHLGFCWTVPLIKVLGILRGLQSENQKTQMHPKTFLHIFFVSNYHVNCLTFEIDPASAIITSFSAQISV
jgi:hypothetical protein